MWALRAAARTVGGAAMRATNTYMCWCRIYYGLFPSLYPAMACPCPCTDAATLLLVSIMLSIIHAMLRWSSRRSTVLVMHD